MAITQDWQGNIGSTTFGAGTDYRMAGPIGGLGTPQIRRSDIGRSVSDGDTGGPDRYAKRVITIPVTIRHQGDAATAQAAVDTFKQAWAKTSTETELTLRIPGTPDTVMSYFGRPRGFNVRPDPSFFPNGMIRGTAVFEGLDPLAYGAAETDNNNTGTFTVTNSGNETSTRCVITLTANGSGAVSLKSTTDSNKTITWGSTLANTTVRVIDLGNRTIQDASGINRVSELAAGYQWFALLSGSNSWTATNCSDVDVAFRSAYT